MVGVLLKLRFKDTDWFTFNSQRINSFL